MGSKLPLSEIAKKDLARGSPPLLPDSRYFPGHNDLCRSLSYGG